MSMRRVSHVIRQMSPQPLRLGLESFSAMTTLRGHGMHGPASSRLSNRSLGHMAISASYVSPKGPSSECHASELVRIEPPPRTVLQ